MIKASILLASQASPEALSCLPSPGVQSSVGTVGVGIVGNSATRSPHVIDCNEYPNPVPSVIEPKLKFLLLLGPLYSSNASSTSMGMASVMRFP